MISKLPSLLEYYGFMFSFFNLLVGPMSEFREYLEFTDRTMFKVTNGTYIIKVALTTLGVIPNSTFVALQKFGVAVLCVVVNLVFGIYFPASYLRTEEFANQNLFVRYAQSFFLLVGGTNFANTTFYLFQFVVHITLYGSLERLLMLFLAMLSMDLIKKENLFGTAWTMWTSWISNLLSLQEMLFLYTFIPFLLLTYYSTGIFE